MPKLTDFISNPGFHPINERIFNSLNYKDLKNCCEVSNGIKVNIETNCRKWKLLNRIQSLKSCRRSDCNETVLQSFGITTFEYFETSGSVEELKILLELIEAWLNEKEFHKDALPKQFAIKYCVIEFVDFISSQMEF